MKCFDTHPKIRSSLSPILFWNQNVRCSEDTMPVAKTIDLCQNPLTKEPKLKMAERLITEWKGIFDDISVIHKEYDDHAEL